MISCMTASTEEQIECIFKNNIFASCEIRGEAARAIGNAISGCNSRQIKYLVQKGVVSALVSLLQSNNPSALLLSNGRQS